MTEQTTRVEPVEFSTTALRRQVLPIAREAHIPNATDVEKAFFRELGNSRRIFHSPESPLWPFYELFFVPHEPSPNISNPISIKPKRFVELTGIDAKPDQLEDMLFTLRFNDIAVTLFNITAVGDTEIDNASLAPIDARVAEYREQVAAHITGLIGEQNGPIARTISFFPNLALSLIEGQELVRRLEARAGRPKNIWYVARNEKDEPTNISTQYYTANDLTETMELIQIMRGELTDRGNFAPSTNTLYPIYSAIIAQREEPGKLDQNKRRLLKLLEEMQLTDDDKTALMYYYEQRKAAELRLEKARNLQASAENLIAQASQTITNRYPRRKNE